MISEKLLKMSKCDLEEGTVVELPGSHEREGSAGGMLGRSPEPRQTVRVVSEFSS